MLLMRCKVFLLCVLFCLIKETEIVFHSSWIELNCDMTNDEWRKLGRNLVDYSFFVSFIISLRKAAVVGQSGESGEIWYGLYLLAAQGQPDEIIIVWWNYYFWCTVLLVVWIAREYCSKQIKFSVLKGTRAILFFCPESENLLEFSRFHWICDQMKVPFVLKSYRLQIWWGTS